MRVWKMCFYSEKEKSMQFVWFTSKVKLDQALKAARTDNSYVDFEPVNIPCTREGLVDWLNRHMTSEITGKVEQLRRNVTARLMAR